MNKINAYDASNGGVKLIKKLRGRTIYKPKKGSPYNGYIKVKTT